MILTGPVRLDPPVRDDSSRGALSAESLLLPIQEDAIQPILSICNVGLIGLIIAAVEHASSSLPPAVKAGQYDSLRLPMQPIAFIFQKGAFVLPPVWFPGLRC